MLNTVRNENTNPGYVASEQLFRDREGFGLAIVGGDHKPLPTYRDHKGNLWIAGKEGQPFGLEVMVPDRGRYALILSVDGLNSMTGQPSTGAFSQDQYWIIDQPSSTGANVIPGWSLPDGKAAQFVFEKPTQSYVAKMGMGAMNCGVVAAQFAFEREDTFRGGFNAKGGGASRGLGAGFGKEVEFTTGTTQFNVDTYRNTVTHIIRFAEEKELIAAGFTLVKPGNLPSAASANPFPAATGRPSCPPPPGWKPR